MPEHSFRHCVRLVIARSSWKAPLVAAFDSIRTALPETTILLRLVFATALGAVIGVDRELRNRPAGLRTHMLVSLAAALFTVIAFELTRELGRLGDNTRADPVRVIEAVTGGVAFLAAGSVIFSRGHVQGVTTGAAMWLAGAVGVASGAGYYVLAIMGALLATCILVAVRVLEGLMPTRPEHEAGLQARPRQRGGPGTPSP